MFPQSLQVTRSPNHWCANSCEISGSSSPGNSRINFASRSELLVLVVALEFSIPPATKSSTTTCAYFSQGYSTPSFSLNTSIIAGVRYPWEKYAQVVVDDF